MPNPPSMTSANCLGLYWLADARERQEVLAGLTVCQGDYTTPRCPYLNSGTCAGWVKRELKAHPGELSGVAAGRFWLNGKPRPVPSRWAEYAKAKRELEQGETTREP